MLAEPNLCICLSIWVMVNLQGSIERTNGNQLWGNLLESAQTLGDGVCWTRDCVSRL